MQISIAYKMLTKNTFLWYSFWAVQASTNSKRSIYIVMVYRENGYVAF